MSRDTDNSAPGSRLFHSYLIVICVSLIMIAVGLSRAAFGVFFKPMADDLGWSAAEISGTFSFSMIIEGIMSAVSGWLSDKLGTRIVLTFSGILAGAGFVLMSQVHSMWQMYLIYGVAMGIGLGGVFVPIVTLIARRFKVNRSLMTGVTLASNGVGQMISPLITHQLITVFSWRTSYVILGFVLFILIVFPAQFLKRPLPASAMIPQANQVTGQSNRKQNTRVYTFREARHTRPFWLIILVFGLGGFCLTSVTVHLVPFAIDIGKSASTAANILAFFCGSLIVGRLAFGRLADKIGNRRMVIIGLIISIVSLLWLIQAKEVWALILFSIVCGLGLGGITPSLSPLVAKFFGLESHGSIFGAIGGCSVVLGATGPFVLGYLFDLTGTYQVPFLVCSIIGALALIVCIMLRPPRETVNQVQKVGNYD